MRIFYRKEGKSGRFHPFRGFERKLRYNMKRNLSIHYRCIPERAISQEDVNRPVASGTPRICAQQNAATALPPAPALRPLPHPPTAPRGASPPPPTAPPPTRFPPKNNHSQPHGWPPAGRCHTRDSGPPATLFPYKTRPRTTTRSTSSVSLFRSTASAT